MAKFYAALPDWEKIERTLALKDKIKYVETEIHYAGKRLQNDITYFANGIGIKARQNTRLEDEVVEVSTKEPWHTKVVNSYMTHAAITLPLTLIGMRMALAAINGYMHDSHHSLDDIVNSIGHYFQPTHEQVHDPTTMVVPAHTDTVAPHDINIPAQEITNQGHVIAVSHDGLTQITTIDSQHVTGTVTGYTETGQAMVHVPAVTQENVVPEYHVKGTLDLSKISLQGSDTFTGKIALVGNGTQDGTIDVHHVDDYGAGQSTETGTDVYKGTYTENLNGDITGKSDIEIHVKDGIATYDMTVPQVTEHATIAAHDEPIDIKNVVPGQNVDLTVPKTTMTTVVPASTGSETAPDYKVIVPEQTIHEDGYTVAEPEEVINVNGYTGKETDSWFWERLTAGVVGVAAVGRTLYNKIMDAVYKPKQDKAYKQLKTASRKLRGTGIRRRARAENPDLDALMREQNLEARVEENGAAEGGAEDEEMQEMEPIEPEAQAPAAPDAQPPAAPQAPGPAAPAADDEAADDGMGQA
jgi:hypothetical protein